MEIISSDSNNLIKKISKLVKDKKYREQYNEYVAEGFRWVTDALNTTTITDIVSQIAVKCSVFDGLEQNYSEFFERYSDRLFIIRDDIFDKITDTKNSQGFLAVLKIIKPNILNTIKHCIILDRVRDPGNVGTIIRTACAAGYSDIFCIDCADVYSPKVVRSCMTGMLKVNIHTVNMQDIDKIISLIKEQSIKICCAALGGENMYSMSCMQKACIVIGNEANGICDKLLSYSDYKVEIPMLEIESLNAAVSAAILMYHLKFSK